MSTNPAPQSPSHSINESPFENIDINPVGTTVMNTRVFKEPRGFMRCVQWFFAIVAFACCCDFSTYVEYTVECNKEPTTVQHVKHEFSYPFQLDHVPPETVNCSTTSKSMQLPGDFSSDAQFFVFTGVLSFLATMGILVVYVFFSEMYFSESKMAPMIDFGFTVIVAIFWLSASSAWANGVINMKYAADPNTWLFKDTHDSMCALSPENTYINTAVKKCDVIFSGNFKKANVSIIVGFLNFFLWASNLWFLYKETSWFSGSGSQQPQGQQQSA